MKALALTANWLRRQKSWEHADAPIAWLRTVVEHTRKRYYPAAMDEERNMFSLNGLTPAGDSFSALIPDHSGDQFITEVHTQVDLLTACAREGLPIESSLLALGRYNSVPFSVAADVLGIPGQTVAKASRMLRAAIPALQDRLAPYRENQRPRAARKATERRMKKL